VELGYNIGFHVHNTITLLSGRDVQLRMLHQRLTYEGWLEGLPSSRENDEMLRSTLKDAQRYCAAGAEPILIQPKRREYHHHPGESFPRRDVAGARWPEFLPSVTCIAVLQSGQLARDSSKVFSDVTVVWFQDEFALPIDPCVIEQLRALDWEQLATDWAP
jgi:hypothetical protein